MTNFFTLHTYRKSILETLISIRRYSFIGKRQRKPRFKVKNYIFALRQRKVILCFKIDIDGTLRMNSSPGESFNDKNVENIIHVNR